jgi:hypothetical protein
VANLTLLHRDIRDSGDGIFLAVYVLRGVAPCKFVPTVLTIVVSSSSWPGCERLLYPEVEGHQHTEDFFLTALKDTSLTLLLAVY